ncbi:flagellar protein FlaG [Thalassotalea sp. G2M2-11]|uniref:flagellar protein FlaG n=1 Tax=Thalassotalea sp. G2M2-11 TaxID=2787627 RepID=UPI0019D1B749|nr:flagellar protein FlaG [Thalassotalea sp. G2M2-11]
MVKPIAIDSQSPNHLSEFAQPKTQVVVDEEKRVSTNTAPIFPSTNEETKAKRENENSLNKVIDKKAEEKVEEQELEEAFNTVSEFMSLYKRNVNFSLDEHSDKTIIKVFDSDSKELIKQFPSEDLLEMARKIHAVRQDIDQKTGIFLDEKV